MNQEFIELYEKHIRNARAIGPENIEAFKRCCYLLFAVDICSTCASTIATYYGKMKEFYDRQLAKGFEPSPIVNTSLTTSSTPTFTTVVMPKPVEKRGRPRK
jgi:Fe-S oxidoreductase